MTSLIVCFALHDVILVCLALALLQLGDLVRRLLAHFVQHTALPHSRTQRQSRYNEIGEKEIVNNAAKPRKTSKHSHHASHVQLRFLLFGGNHVIDNGQEVLLGVQ